MAHDAIAFITARQFCRVDLLGFSIGSFVAQEIALIRPDLVRRVVLASSAPAGAEGIHGWAADVIGAVGKPETSAEELAVGGGGDAGHQPVLARSGRCRLAAPGAGATR